MFYYIILVLFVLVVIVGIFLIIDGEYKDGISTIAISIIFFGIISAGCYYIDKSEEDFKNKQDIEYSNLLPKYTQMCDNRDGVLNVRIKTSITNRTIFLTCSNGKLFELPFY